MHHWTSYWEPGRKAPPPVTEEGKNFKTGSIHFMQFPATLVQLAEKAPPPPHDQEGENWRLDLFIHAISSNFGSAGRKAPPPTKEVKNWRLDLSISCNFQQFWFSWQKKPPQQTKEVKNLRLDLFISCNFQQLWFRWQKRPPFLPFHERMQLTSHM